MVPINSTATLTQDVTGLDKYTEYEFQVLAFTSVGDGPKSSVEVERTKEDGNNLVVMITDCQDSHVTILFLQLLLHVFSVYHI